MVTPTLQVTSAVTKVMRPGYSREIHRIALHVVTVKYCHWPGRELSLSACVCVCVHVCVMCSLEEKAAWAKATRSLRVWHGPLR
jgi:hypothetical protein